MKDQKRSKFISEKNRTRARPGFLAYFIRLNPDKMRRRAIAAFDMETADGTLLGPIAGICFTSDLDYPNVKTFSSMVDFLDMFLRKQYRGFVAYAHKGMSFDIAHMLANEDVQKWLISEGYTVQVDRSFAIVRRKQHSWYLGDSLRVFNYKLEEVLQAFAPDHTKMSLPKTRFSWKHSGWRARITEDTVGLYLSLKHIEQIIFDTFQTPLSITMPATALKAARISLTKPVWKVRRPPRLILDWIRAGAYSGGRIEVFHQGEVRGNIYCFDVNSAYAWAMKGELPLGPGKYLAGEPDYGYYIGRCAVNVPIESTIPPVISRLFHHAFCVGEFQAMLTQEEVELARECGATVQVLECWVWRRTFPVFRSFIKTCEALRRTDYFGALGKTVKLMQNGLYGILGMNPFRKAQMLSMHTPPMPWIHAFDTKSGTIIPNTFEAIIFRESPNQMAHWAAIITARVRVHLTRYLLAFEKAGMRPLYAHTDSIWAVAQNGIPLMIQSLISDEYGKLKVEHVGDRAIIVSPGEAALRFTKVDSNGKRWHLASKGWTATPEMFEHGIALEIEQTQVFRAGTALKRRKAGRITKKVVMNYANMSNRYPAPFRPGRTIPKRARPFSYERYWSLRSWYVGKLLKDRPLWKRFLLSSALPPAILEDVVNLNGEGE